MVQMQVPVCFLLTLDALMEVVRALCNVMENLTVQMEVMK